MWDSQEMRGVLRKQVGIIKRLKLYNMYEHEVSIELDILDRQNTGRCNGDQFFLYLWMTY